MFLVRHNGDSSFKKYFLKESLRKWGQAVIIDRKALKPYTIPPKYPEEKPLHVDAGSAVMLPMFLIQRDEKYFPNPEKFDPDRFSDENKSKIVSGTYFPFGMGPRICIGILDSKEKKQY